MFRILSAFAVTALVVGLTLPAHAAMWDVDPAHSNVGFVVKHLVVSKVRGNFKKFEGKVVLDDKDITKSTVTVSIAPESIDTDNEKRDDHLRSPDFFDVKKFPAMTFKSTKVEKGAPGHLKVTGDLTLHGVTKPVVLDVEGPSAEVKDPGGNPHVGFSATTTINRKDFGLAWGKIVEGTGAVVSDDVKIELDIELANKH